MVENLREKEHTIGRVASSPFFVGYAVQFGGRSSDEAQNWLRDFSDRVIKDTLTAEDETLIERCEASIEIAREFGFVGSLSNQQQAQVLQALLDRYPPPPDDEDEDEDDADS